MQINLPSRLTSENSSRVEGNRESFQRPSDIGGYWNHIFRLKKVIDNMTNRGLPIDKERLVEFKEYLVESSKRVRSEIAIHLEKVSQEKGHVFHGWHPSSEGYKTLPEDLREFTRDRAYIITQTVIKRKKTLVDGKSRMLPTEVEEPIAKYPTQLHNYQWWFIEKVKELGYEFTSIATPEDPTAVVKRVHFNPNSRDQLEAYCNMMGYTIPIVTKKTEHGRELKASLDDKALQKLGRTTGDPIFKLIEEMREVEKLITTYCDGWMPNGSDGRLHSTFMLNSGTGQLRSRNPNVQNAPSHSGEYGKKFKSIVRARESRLIANFDWTGFHALMLGYFAESPEYMRLSQFGVHDYLAAYMLRNILTQAQGNWKSRAWEDCRGKMFYRKQGDEYEKELLLLTEAHVAGNIPSWLTLNDTNLRAKLSWIKKNHKYLRDKKSKVICHSTGFAAQASGIYEKNEDSFSNKKEVEGLMQVFFDAFPAIKRFQGKIAKQAHEDRKLVSPFGYVRRFYETLTWKRGELDKGEQYSESVAFLPANTAFGVKKEVMLDLESRGYNEKYCFFNEVHDSLMYEPLERDVDEAVRVVYAAMTAPMKLLSHPKLCPDGLVCGAEVSVGSDWSNLEEVKI